MERFVNKHLNKIVTTIGLLGVIGGPSLALAQAFEGSFGPSGPLSGNLTPLITITSPTSDATYTTADGSVTVSGTTLGAVTAVTCAPTLGSCTCTVDTSAETFTCGTVLLAGGSNTVTVTATVAGKSGINDTITITSTLSPPGSPTLWFAADKETSYADGASVSTMTDFGSLAKNATQATASAQPTYRTTCAAGKLGNRPCFSFNGNNYLTTVDFAALPQPNLTCIVIAINSGLPGIYHTYDGNQPASDRNTIYTRSTGKWSFYAGLEIESSVTATAGQYEMICATFNGASSTLRVSGAQTTGNPGSWGQRGLYIASYQGNYKPNGHIAELIIYDTPPAVADVEAYLTTKYGSFPQ